MAANLLIFLLQCPASCCPIIKDYRNQVNSKLFFRQKNVPWITPESLRSNSRKQLDILVRVVRNIRISDLIFVFFLRLFGSLS